MFPSAIDIVSHRRHLVDERLTLDYSLLDAGLAFSLRSTFIRLYQRLASVHQYRMLNIALDAEFANATPRELLQSNDVCAICLESLSKGRTKKLHCSNLFHAVCLRSHVVSSQQRPILCLLCRANELIEMWLNAS